MLVQRKWMYLESIFVGSDDIRHQLPQEAKRFDTIDKQWQKIMAETAKNTNVLDACNTDGRYGWLLFCYLAVSAARFAFVKPVGGAGWSCCRAFRSSLSSARSR